MNTEMNQEDGGIVIAMLSTSTTTTSIKESTGLCV